MMRLVSARLQEGGVGGGVHQLLGLGGIAQLDDEHPALAIGVAVDEFRRIA